MHTDRHNIAKPHYTAASAPCISEVLCVLMLHLKITIVLLRMDFLKVVIFFLSLRTSHLNKHKVFYYSSFVSFSRIYVQA